MCVGFYCFVFKNKVNKFVFCPFTLAFMDSEN